MNKYLVVEPNRELKHMGIYILGTITTHYNKTCWVFVVYMKDETYFLSTGMPVGCVPVDLGDKLPLVQVIEKQNYADDNAIDFGEKVSDWVPKLLNFDGVLDQKIQLKSLLRDFSDVFSKDEFDVGYKKFK